MNILVINGPNLNLLGMREIHIYGKESLDEIMAWLESSVDGLNHHFKFYQSNSEGELINIMQDERQWASGILLNAGALSHYSYAIADTIKAIQIPTIEIHMSDINKRESFRKKLRNNEMDNKEIEIDMQDSGSFPTIDLQGGQGAGIGMINLNDMLGKAMGPKTKKKKITVGDSYEILVNEESDKMIDSDHIINEAKKSVEDNGIVFIDEIDKVCARSERVGGDVSREGVQRDLLPLIEGTTVNTKHGTIKTDHILFVASGAFQLSKPSDLLPELQGRLPIRVSLKALTQNDFKRILTEPEYSLIKQYEALLGTENVTVKFTEDGIDAIATLAVEINSTIENIGARRLHTILERVLEDISFTAADKSGESVVIDAEYVKNNVNELSKDTDLSKYIL